MTLRIEPMTLDHLRIAIDWAAAEGWNPGHDDAQAFYEVDAQGFLMGWLGDTPVTAISVVRHSDGFGFLGFYLCHPDHRGKGYGMATWQAGIAHLGDRVVGLDGVPAQVANYETSGFELAHYTKRYAGQITETAQTNCRLANPADLPVLLQMDLDISGTDRGTYLSNWFSQTRSRQTLVYEANAQIVGCATIRACRTGHKIGPILAESAETARSLIEASVAYAQAQEIMIDVPDPNSSSVDLAHSLGLDEVFSCARMYTGGQLVRDVKSIFSETTFELG